MHTTIPGESPIVESSRVALVRGLFDLPPQPVSRLTWARRLFMGGFYPKNASKQNLKNL